MLNLVSDDKATNEFNANIGITLPDNNDATYNSGLSPIFIFRPGGSWLNDRIIGGRGLGIGFWSMNARWSTQAYHSGIKGDAMFYPSDRNSRADYALSLRCLVSTNNGIMINPNS